MSQSLENMASEDRTSGYATHEVMNQPTPLEDYNAFTGDRPLREAVRAFGAQWSQDELSQCGALVGSKKVQSLAHMANRNIPELCTHDRFGNRVDVIEFHPAYHELMTLIYGSECHSFAWRRDLEGAHVARAALNYLWNQAENGICCPMTMSFASIPALKHDPQILSEWAPAINNAGYNPKSVYAKNKSCVTVGMAMTEKQGGSDLRATMTTAQPTSARRGSGAPYQITGHKWFFSAPMSDLFLTLAQTDKGLSCFLATGWLPDDSRNRLKLQRLKNKCGNRSNASSEVEFYGLHAVMVGEEGRGIRTIVDMVHSTRLDFAVGSSGLMRQALSQAIHHTTHRRAFQRNLVDLPMMENVIADLSVECEAMMWTSMRLARAYDRSATDERERILSRVATPVLKYWACKRAPQFVVEALECHGGNGFIADHLMERLYREAPLNGIWEGTGNVICLDVLRSMEREPDALAVFFDEVCEARGADGTLDRLADELRRKLAEPSSLEPVARRVVERMAFLLQASLLLRYSTSDVAETFCQTRLAGDHGYAFGTIPAGPALHSIIDRARIG